jgi:predicted dehydrogenase
VVVGLVGCGEWGRHILRDLVSLGCTVPVVARSHESSGRAEQGGASVVVPDVASLPSVDGVVVATPTSTHSRVVGAALELGVPVFCEKPLASSAAAAAELAESAPDRLFVMDKWRYHPGIVELAAIARDGRLGTTVGLRTKRVGWGSPHDDADVVWHLAPHELAIGLEILGSPTSAVAAVATWVGSDAWALDGILEGEGWWHVLEVSGTAPERQRRVELHCDEGVAVLADGWDAHILLYRRSGGDASSHERVETAGELPLLAELRAFVGHLRGGAPPRSSAAEGARIVATIAELRRLAGAP